MRNTGTAVLGAALGLVGRSASARPANTWVPDRIIEGRNNPALDAPAVQAAVSDPSVARLLLVGRFDFGDGTSAAMQTVVIPRGLDIRGRTVEDPSGRIVTWSTEIVGGGALLPSLFGNSHSGPFKVLNYGAGGGGNDNPVRFRGIAFTRWCAEAIFAEDCIGLEVSECKFTEAIPGTLLPGFRMVNAVFAGGPWCVGRFAAENNTCVFGEYSVWPHDEQLMACFASSFSEIIIRGNDITGHDEGVEVILNGFFAEPSFRSTIAIETNSFALTHDDSKMPIDWGGTGGHVAIVCLWNVHADSITLTDNQINTVGLGSAAALTGENCLVRNNRIHQVALNPNDGLTYPFAGLILGLYATFPGFPPLDTVTIDFNDSLIANNTFSGIATFGMVTLDTNPAPPAPPVTPPNHSHGNTAVGNNLANLAITPGGATLYLAPKTHDNVFKGNFATVVDLGDDNVVTGYQTRSGGIGPQVSEPARRFRDALQSRAGVMLAGLRPD